MTDIEDLGTFEWLDPNNIDLGDNVRTVEKLERSFVQSIDERGVLVPVVCRRIDGKDNAKMGFRRIIAARQVGRLVPARVVEGDDTTVERILDQFAENEHRTGLTEPERAAVFQQLAFEGLTVPQIAKKTGVKRATVEAGIAVADNEFAGKIATKHEITLDQAAIILEFEGDKEAVKRLVDCAEHSPEQFPHEVQRQRDDRQRRAVREQAEAEAQAQGFTILDRTPGYYDKTPVALSELIDKNTGEPVTVEQITGLPGAAAHVRVYVDGEVETLYYLDDPKPHGFKKRPQNGAASGPMTEEQKAERRQLIANNKAWISAEAVRREWLTSFLGRKTLPKEATLFIATMLTRYRRKIGDALPQANRLASEFLGLPQPAGYSEADPLTTLAEEQPRKAGHAALAMVLASMESTTSKETWRYPDAAAEHYFAQIAAWGYPLSEVEQIVVGVDPDPDPTDAQGEASAEPVDQTDTDSAAAEEVTAA